MSATKNKKLALWVSALTLLAATEAISQQITRFGVVDMGRVYTASAKNTAAMKNYEAKRQEFQSEIDQQTEELKLLQSKKLEAERVGNAAQLKQMEDQIKKKVDFLTDYSSKKNQELESLRGKLQGGDPFYTRLYSVLGKIAESEGFSMILSLQQSNGILWYSPTVDITDKVINEMGK